MRLFQAILWSLSLTIFVGCEEAADPPALPHPQAFRVKGRLIVGNTVAANARIAFHPMDPEKSQGRCPVALTRSDGTFELTTYTMDDGAPEGDYTVTVTLPDDTMPEDECECINPLQHDRLGGKYADPQKTPLLVSVLPRDNKVNLCTEVAKRTGLKGFALPQNRDDIDTQVAPFE